MLKALALFSLGLMNLVIGLVVFLRDPKRTDNVLFSCLVLSIGVWVIAIGAFLLTNSREAALLIAKVYYLFPLFITASTVLFAKSFPANRPIGSSWWTLTLTGLLLLAVPLLFIPTFITHDLVYHAWGKEIILNKVHYFFYALYLLACIVIALWNMYRVGKQERGLYAAQAKLFFVGFLISVWFAVIFNLLLPWAGNYRLIHIGPLFTNIFVVVIAYSIIRHRMFDVRWVIARSVAYVLSITVLVVGYSLISFVVAARVFGKIEGFTTQSAINIVLLIFIALTYTPVRKFFDKVTNRIFYHDAYDTQVFLDELNRILVRYVDLEPLLRKSAYVIQKNLKAEFCVFALKETTATEQRIIGTQARQFDAEEINFVRGITPHIHHKIIVTDYLEMNKEKLKVVLEKNDIAILARLIGSTKKVAEGSGYLILGPKKSGNPYSNQDIKILEIIVNELVIAIENALRFEEIENFNVTLQQKVNSATRQLRETNEKLKLLDESKDEFISMASHQLRTPLTSVKGYISMVMDGDAGAVNDNQRKLLDQAFVSSQRMVYLIADLLNVSRLRTGKFLIEPHPTDLAAVIESEISQLTETAKLRGLQLSFDKPSTFPILMLDETKIRQVVMNFVDNAIYYTPSGGHITLSLKELPETVEFTVVDDGIGVPKHEQHNMFNKFYRAENAKKARPDGTGLGLFMAKKVVIAHGGAIIFKSQENEGSTFGFTLNKSKLKI